MHLVVETEVGEEQKMINEHHDHELVEHFDTDSALIDVWFDASIPDDVGGAEQNQ